MSSVVYERWLSSLTRFLSRRTWAAMVAMMSSWCATADGPAMPETASGRIERLSGLDFRGIPERPVDVWLPDDYPSRAPYAVVYLHDGQMLFDARVGWNGQEWRFDETAGALSKQSDIRPFIAVGVWNGGPRRHGEYFPAAAFRRMSASERQHMLAIESAPGQPLFPEGVDSDDYLDFLVRSLKPAIDRRFKVDPRRDATFVMGSSMGGLISLEAAMRYGNVFSAAACLSTHWLGTFEPAPSAASEALFASLRAQLPSPPRTRIYVDHGTATLDAHYPPLQERVDRVFAERGYRAPGFVSLRFDGADHSERAWAERLETPLRFLLTVPTSTDAATR